MAHANFIDRAVTSASQILRGFDPAAYKAALEGHLIGVAFDNAASKSAEGAAALDLTVRLLARLFPALAFIPLDNGARASVRALTRLARSINPEIGLERDLKKVTTCMVLGETIIDCGQPSIHIGSEGWIARLSSKQPVGSGESKHAFGAGAAACFGVANVFRAVFGDQLIRGDLDSEIALSTFDFSSDANPKVDAVDLGETHLVGVGAVGNGAIWAWQRIARLKGMLDLIDHENVDLSNLQRYVLTTQKHRDVAKVQIAADLLRRDGLSVRPHAVRWEEYLDKRGDWRLQRIAVAVDSATGRIAVQAALPRWIANGWTQPGDLGVSRHGFDADAACLACLYMPTEKQPNEDEIVRDALRLPVEAQMKVRELLDRGTPVGSDFVALVAANFGIEPGKLMSFAEKPLRSFYLQAICGGAVFTLTQGKHAVPAVVPMAFQSALAGVLLAGEVVSHTAGLKTEAQPVKATINLLRPLAGKLTTRMQREPSGRCICHDDDFRAAYARKYLVAVKPTPLTVVRKRQRRAP